MTRLLLGNLISLCGAVFLGASCLAKEKRTAYFCLFAESVLLAAAQIVFRMPAGAVALTVSAGRNLLVAFDRFGRFEAILFSVLTAVCGILSDLTALGGIFETPVLFLNFLPVLAGVQLTVTSYAAKSLQGIRAGILANVFLWVVYSFYVLDFVSAVSNLAIFVVDITVLFDTAIRAKKALRDDQKK